MREARLRAAKTFIAQNIKRQDLSARRVVAHFGITPRYLHMLFEKEGESFSELMLGQRLLQTHALLSDPSIADRPIGTVAPDAGFGDLSHFNRTFCRRFGCTPSDVREAARRA
jgi:AraC-like DNA-binding protein